MMAQRGLSENLDTPERSVEKRARLKNRSLLPKYNQPYSNLRPHFAVFPSFLWPWHCIVFLTRIIEISITSFILFQCLSLNRMALALPICKPWVQAKWFSHWVVPMISRFPLSSPSRGARGNGGYPKPGIWELKYHERLQILSCDRMPQLVSALLGERSAFKEEATRQAKPVP